jgi:predicted ATPase/DNA-binding SARP family transcriptional activator
VGRGRELADVEALLAERRLVTLIGPGGTGKTRLALELARRAAVPVAWTELAPVHDPNLIAHQVLSTLGGRSSGQSLAIESVLERIGTAPYLLVLDNCEHLIAGCALLARALLHGCPATTILATTREALGVAGEHVWPVPPLSLPAEEKTESAGTSEAVALFVERARAVAPRFELDQRNVAAVVDICRRVDGLPLAVELAAARVRALTPEEIARRLAASIKLLASSERSVDPRHRTLEATIDWSYQLLDDVEKMVLGRLSVFAGGFSLEAAERICSCCDVERDRVLDVVTALVDKSLVLAEPRGAECRYRLLETVRQYAWERQEPQCAAALRELHAEIFLELAEAAEPHVFGGAASPSWMSRLEAELANLRAAIDWALERPATPPAPEAPGARRADAALRLGSALHWFWFACGRLREGRRVLSRALADADGASSGARGHALIALGQVAIWQGEYDLVRESMEQGIACVSEVPGDDFWRAYGRCGLAVALSVAGEYDDQLMALLDESVGGARRHSDTVLLPFALYWRARVRAALGEHVAGIEDADEAVAISRRIGHRPGTAHCLDVAGTLRLAAGDATGAAECLRECLAIHLETGDQWGIARVLEDLAVAASERGRYDRAVVFHAAGERIRHSIGSPHVPAERAVVDAALARCRSKIGEAEFARAWEEGSSLELERVGQAAEAVLDLLAAGAGSSGVPTELPGDRSDVPPAEEELALVAGAVARGTGAAAATPAAAVGLEIRALGAAEVRIDGAAVEGLWGRPKELLVLLAWNAEGLRREDVGLALWPDASPEKLRNLFHVTLHRLRKSMGARDWIVREGERYRLSAALGWELDARRFEGAASAALRDLRARRDAAVDALARALALYRGDFLAGETVAEWHYEVRERLRELWLEGSRALGKALVERGRDAEAAEVFRRLLEREPVDEEASRNLIACALRRGDRNEGMREYRRLERALDQELGVEPGPEIAKLYQQLRRGGAD